jgi:hypothetical protein
MRGLRLECKKPQLADTELKEMGYAETGNTGNIYEFYALLIGLMN